MEAGEGDELELVAHGAEFVLELGDGGFAGLAAPVECSHLGYLIHALIKATGAIDCIQRECRSRTMSIPRFPVNPMRDSLD